eukprot:968846-Lingulodinium_polyedra.AAC.1
MACGGRSDAPVKLRVPRQRPAITSFARRARSGHNCASLPLASARRRRQSSLSFPPSGANASPKPTW